MKSVVRLFLLLMLAFSKLVEAQGTLDALTFYPPLGGGSANTPGNVYGGVGWSFVSSSDLQITAISSTAPQVSFWLGTNQILMSYNYGESNLNFQSISPLLLSAGQTYYVSTQNSNFSATVDFGVYSRLGIDGMAIFDNSTYLTNFGNYVISSAGQWSPNLTGPLNNADFLFVGPNFQFQVVPEPISFEFLLLTVGVWFFRRRTFSNNFHVRKTN